MKKPVANAYITTGDAATETALAKYNSFDKFENIQRVTASSNNVTQRSGFHTGDYYRARPQDATPSKFNDVIQLCRMAYLRVGIVRNVIDLMTDFACGDVRLIHPDKNVEAFLKVWMNKVKLQDAID